MPRLSHIFDITPVEREVVLETVDAAYEVARSCRFDGRGWLLLPEEGTRELLYSRAEELGIIDPETAERGRRERHEAVERLQEGTLSPERAEELAIGASTLALQLQSGNHLAPYSHYLVAELSPEGVPIEPADEDKGWSGTGLTITSWDEEAAASVDFAMPDTRGSQGPPVTSGTVVHDTATARLTGSMRIQIPGRGAWLRSATGAVTIDTNAWYLALDGEGDGTSPALLEAEHRLVRVRAWLAPTRGDDGRWVVEAVLDVRGRGVFRPVVAMMLWALRSSIRRADAKSARRGDGEPTIRERLYHHGCAWDRLARNAPYLPGFLREVARALVDAAPDQRPDR
ncbi:MAG TPA: hypothetical protein H9836_04745 [Candidatus Nocardiopsis merdipullorum]|nr:hypothetical protein [Candidatus Nocardiopsis merdipullorum]